MEFFRSAGVWQMVDVTTNSTLQEWLSAHPPVLVIDGEEEKADPQHAEKLCKAVEAWVEFLPELDDGLPGDGLHTPRCVAMGSDGRFSLCCAPDQHRNVEHACIHPGAANSGRHNNSNTVFGLYVLVALKLFADHADLYEFLGNTPEYLELYGPPIGPNHLLITRDDLSDDEAQIWGDLRAMVGETSELAEWADRLVQLHATPPGQLPALYEIIDYPGQPRRDREEKETERGTEQAFPSDTPDEKRKTVHGEDTPGHTLTGLSDSDSDSVSGEEKCPTLAETSPRGQRDVLPKAGMGVAVQEHSRTDVRVAGREEGLAEVRKWKKRCRRLKNEREEMEDERDAARGEKRELTKSLKDAESQLHSLRGELADARGKLQEAEKERDAERQGKINAEVENDRLQSKNRTLEADKSGLRQRVTQLERDCRDRDDRIRELDNEIRELKKKIREPEEDLMLKDAQVEPPGEHAEAPDG